MDEPRIIWTKGGELLMRRRDHYAQTAIRREFKPDKSASVAVDQHQRWFVTPVADLQYSVLWREDPDDRQNVLVEAVLPAYFSKKRAGHLATQVREAVERESGGVVNLAQLEL